MQELKYQQYDTSNRLTRCSPLLERVAREQAVAEERVGVAEEEAEEATARAANAEERVGVAEAAVVAATERAVDVEERAGVAEGRVAEVEERLAEAGALEVAAATARVGVGQTEEPTYEVLPLSIGTTYALR